MVYKTVFPLKNEWDDDYKSQIVLCESALMYFAGLDCVEFNYWMDRYLDLCDVVFPKPPLNTAQLEFLKILKKLK